MVTVGHHDRLRVAAHQVLIGTGTAGSQHMIERDIPLVGKPSQREALRCPYRDNIQELAK